MEENEMLVEKVIISSNSNDLLNYTPPTTSERGNDLIDMMKYFDYIVTEKDFESKQIDTQV